MDREVRDKVVELGGWFEGDVIVFPTPDAEEQFDRWSAAYEYACWCSDQLLTPYYGW